MRSLTIFNNSPETAVVQTKSSALVVFSAHRFGYAYKKVENMNMVKSVSVGTNSLH